MPFITFCTASMTGAKKLIIASIGPFTAAFSPSHALVHAPFTPSQIFFAKSVSGVSEFLMIPTTFSTIFFASFQAVDQSPLIIAAISPNTFLTISQSARIFGAIVLTHTSANHCKTGSTTGLSPIIISSTALKISLTIGANPCIVGITGSLRNLTRFSRIGCTAGIIASPSASFMSPQLSLNFATLVAAVLASFSENPPNFCSKIVIASPACSSSLDSSFSSGKSCPSSRADPPKVLLICSTEV